jgi:Ca-activated chloride channel homolog
MMQFVEWPWAVALVVILPLLGMLIFSAERRSRAERLAKLGTRSMLVRLAPFGARLGAARTARITGALALFGLAFAGPRWGLGKTIASSNGVDVALVMDASLSMLATDAPPTRLENMKNVVRQLRAQSPNDRFALVAFAAHSYILSPLTTDQSALDLYLNNLDPTTVGVAGTSLASAIKQATTLLSLRHSDASRAIVLMSDGEDFETMNEVTNEAKRAGEAGITLITVGFGTTRGSTIPIQQNGGGMILKKDRTGKIVVTHYTPSFLSQAAQAAAHGVFIPAEAPDKAGQIRNVLTKIKTEVRGTETGVDLAPQFQLFTLLGFLLMLLDTFIVLRPRRRVLAVSAATLAAAACGEQAPAPIVRAPVTPPKSYVALYNQGTKAVVKDSLLSRGQQFINNDSLTASVAALDSALNSPVQTVRYRAAFNRAWPYLVVGRSMTHRFRDASTASQQKLAAIAAAIVASDSAWADSMVIDDSALSDSTAYAATRRKKHLSPEEKFTQDTAKAHFIIDKQVDSAIDRYRATLVANPNDLDTKWNYELAWNLLQSIDNSKPRAGNSEKRNRNMSNQKFKKRFHIKTTKQKDQEGKNQDDNEIKKRETMGAGYNHMPPMERLKLPQQQAEQLLNSVGQHEQKAAKAVPIPDTPQPQGKDW